MREKIISILIILFGFSLLSYPFLSNYLFEKSAGSTIKTYQQSEKTYDQKKKEQEIQKAERYNELLTRSTVELTDPFKAKKTDGETAAYNNILNLDRSGIMGYLNVPCININLPIYHGTEAEILEKGVGHLAASSLPVGGKSTHSILTGHTGLSSAKLFTDLTEMKKGDYFFIHVLDKTLAYQVDQISIVLPEDTKKLQIINGKDYVTLVTYLTTAPKSNHPAHVKVQCGKPGTALCEKSQTISKSFLENYIGTLTEEEMFQIDRGIQIGYGIKNNVYDYDNEEDSFVKDIANYIQEMDHLLSKLCDLKELDQKARHIDIEQLLGKDVIALGRILPDSGLEAVRAAMVSQADKEQKKIREKLELMIGKR